MGTQLARHSNLTEMQTTFVIECAKGVPPIVAATIAGYASPEQTAYNLRSNPNIQSAIVAEVRRFLISEAAPAAMRLMFDFMNDKDLDKKLRLACAKTVADRAGFIAPKAKDNSGLEAKSLVDMSAEEMKEMASRIQKELSDRAVTIIDHAPSDGAQHVQAVDIFD